MNVPTPVSDVTEVVRAAAGATGPLRTSTRDVRADWLDAIADALERAAGELVPLAYRETAIPLARLDGELARTTGQLRMFAGVCRDAAYLEAMIDPGDPDAQPLPRPELRRMLVPLGPVAVFSASNFPFAFSVAGGDTASALAAGCPVVVKAHSGHPLLSDATAEVVRSALRRAGAPEGTFGMVHGTQQGRDLVQAPAIKAAGFTGSVGGGRALFDLASTRPEPIPFYGELGSINPVFVTRSAAEQRAAEIAHGFVASLTTNTGQMCTKPGIVLVPAGSEIGSGAAALARQVEVGALLNARISQGFGESVSRWMDVPGVEVLCGESGRGAGPDADSVVLVAADVPTLLANPALTEEAFGPAAVIVEYRSDAELVSAARAVPPSLSAALFASEGDPELDLLLPVLGDAFGRLVWNGWTTGVAVTPGQHHGGPYPATTSPLHTSVGATAIRRWLRPLAFQDWPTSLLPAELRDEAPVPQQISGTPVDDR